MDTEIQDRFGEMDARLIARMRELPRLRIFIDPAKVDNPTILTLSRHVRSAALMMKDRVSHLPPFFVLDFDQNYGNIAEISARLSSEFNERVNVQSWADPSPILGENIVFYVPRMDGVWEGGGIMSTFFSARRFGLEQVMIFNDDAWPAEPYGLVIDPLGSGYFNQNRQKILKCYASMADEASRLTFAAGLHARLSGDCTVLPVAKYPQYFHPVVHAEPNDIFVEAGVEDGETTAAFSHAVDRGGEVIGFEPVCQFHDRINQRLADCENVTLEALGLWSVPSTLYIDLSGGGSSVQSEETPGTVACELIDLDSYLDGRRITMLKMDIESAETAALKGAERTIRKWRPKLAICVYHSPRTQFIEIINYIIDLDLNYTLYIGHHSPIVSETVLYGMPR